MHLRTIGVGKKVSILANVDIARHHMCKIIYAHLFHCSIHSGYRGAAARADQLLDTMESKYLAGDMGLKPNTFTYNAVSVTPRSVHSSYR